MAAGKINLQKASGGITAITGVDGAGNTQLVLPESGIVATTAGATEATTGLIELATTAETQAGIDDTRAITPLKLKNSVLGLGQTWQDVTASRVLGTTYTNTTGKPVLIQVSIDITTSGLWRATVAGVIVSDVKANPAYQDYVNFSFIVPNGSTYSVTQVSGAYASMLWSELR